MDELVELKKLLCDIEQEINRRESIGEKKAANLKRKRLKFLWNATRIEELESFHTKCAGKSPTVTILHGKYGVWFGGYTSICWTKGKKDTKDDKQAFLFYKRNSSNDTTKFFRIKKKRAITCDDNFGPTFGGGKKSKDYDLQTFILGAKNNSADKDGYMQLNGQIHFGNAYEGEGPKPSKTDINNGTMDIELMEIYEVVDETTENMWREKPNDDEVAKMWNHLLKIDPPKGLEIKAYNILLVGVINAGKSSFFNTLLGLFADKVKSDVATASEVKSVTNKLQKRTLIYKGEMPVKINIFDIRGYDKQRGYEPELKHILDGRLPPDYEFPEEAKEVKEDMLKKDSLLNDKMHLVCFVVDGQTFLAQQLDDNLRSKQSEITQIIRRTNIPIAAVVTKLDLVCRDTNFNANNVYTSPLVHKTIEKVAKVLGMEKKNVHPIVNFVNDTEIVEAKRRLVIQALHSMVRLAENNLEDLIPKEGTKEKIAVSIRSDIEEYKHKSMPRILCVGEVKSGRTSFICSIRTALTGKPSTKAAGRGNRRSDRLRNESITDTNGLFRFCPPSKKNNPKRNPNPISSGNLLHFQKLTMEDGTITFGDMPGFSETGEIGLEHIQMVINGEVVDGCKITPGGNETILYKRVSNKKDQFNCVCIVMDITSLDTMSKKSSDLIMDIKDWIDEIGICYVFILTNIDLAESRKLDVEDKVRVIAEKFEIDVQHVFAVQNYLRRQCGIDEVDVRLLNALKKIVELWKENVEAEEQSSSKRFEDGSDDKVGGKQVN